jgi:hypothetical protein
VLHGRKGGRQHHRVGVLPLLHHRQELAGGAEDALLQGEHGEQGEQGDEVVTLPLPPAGPGRQPQAPARPADACKNCQLTKTLVILFFD